nr:hypothetical protein Iba_chr03aCG21490 [Ipomoea batatas]
MESFTLEVRDDALAARGTDVTADFSFRDTASPLVTAGPYWCPTEPLENVPEGNPTSRTAVVIFGVVLTAGYPCDSSLCLLSAFRFYWAPLAYTKGDAGTSDPKLLVLAADILLGPLLCGSAREFTKSNTKAKTSSSPYKDKQQFCKSITFEETGLLENLSSLGLGSRQSSAETTSSSSPAASVSGWICILGRNLVPVLETLNEIPILRCLYSSTSASDYDLNRIKSGAVVQQPCSENQHHIWPGLLQPRPYPWMLASVEVDPEVAQRHERLPSWPMLPGGHKPKDQWLTDPDRVPELVEEEGLKQFQVVLACYPMSTEMH